MKKKIVYLVVAVLLAGLLPAAQASAAAGEKAVKINATTNSAGILLDLSCIAPSLLVDNSTNVTVINSGNVAISFYLRTDVNWAVDTILTSSTVTLQPDKSVMLNCGYQQGATHVLLMASASTPVGTPATLTICSLSEADAQTLAETTGGQIVDSPSFYPGTLPTVGGGSLLFTERNHRCAGPKQDIKAILEENGPGQYYISGWMRLKNAESRGVQVNIGTEIKTDSTKWPQTSVVVVNNTEWVFVQSIVDLNWTGTLKSAILFTQTIYNDIPSGGNTDTYAYKGDVEWDAFSMNFLESSSASGFVFSENLLSNPDCDCDRFGVTADWSVNQSATLSNPAFAGPDFSATENSDGSVTYAKGFVPATDKNIKYIGRWTKQNDNSYKGSFESYCEIKFTGTEIAVLSPASGSVYLQVDDNAPVLATLSGSYKVASNLSAGEHTLRIYAHAQQAFPQIGGFVINENAKTLPGEEKKIIEFVGDSITEGYVGPGQNSYLYSYAYKTGELLGWDYNTVAFGGITMTPGYGSPDTSGMVNRYFLEREFLSSDTEQTVVPEWDTSKFKPDYMVINLGTNDSGASAADFTAAYKEFIEKVQDAYPEITIFAMTPFNGQKAAQIRDIVKELNDSKIILIDSATWGIPGGEDNLHPTAASHDVAAQKLYEAITQALNPTTTTPSESPAAPTQQPDPQGIEITLSNDITSNGVLSLNGLKGFIDTTKKTATFTVYNTGDSDISFQFGVRATGSKSWPVIGKDTGVITLAAGDSQTITITGIQDSVVNDLGDTLTFDDYFAIIVFTAAQKDGQLTVSGFTPESIQNSDIKASFAVINAAYTLPDTTDAPKNDGAVILFGSAFTVMASAIVLLYVIRKKKQSLKENV